MPTVPRFLLILYTSNYAPESTLPDRVKKPLMIADYTTPLHAFSKHMSPHRNIFGHN